MVSLQIWQRMRINRSQFKNKMFWLLNLHAGILLIFFSFFFCFLLCFCFFFYKKIFIYYVFFFFFYIFSNLLSVSSFHLNPLSWLLGSMRFKIIFAPFVEIDVWYKFVHNLLISERISNITRHKCSELSA